MLFDLALAGVKGREPVVWNSLPDYPRDPDYPDYLRDPCR